MGIPEHFTDVDFQIMDVLNPVVFMEDSGLYPLTKGILRIPWWKRRKIDSIVRDHRATDQKLVSIYDLVDRMRAELGDGFFVRHEQHFFHPTAFNIVVGIQTPYECQIMRELGFDLLYLESDPPQSRWERTGHTCQRVLWNASLVLDRSQPEESRAEVYAIFAQFVKDYRNVMAEGTRDAAPVVSVSEERPADAKPSERDAVACKVEVPDVVPRRGAIPSPSPNGASDG